MKLLREQKKLQGMTVILRSDLDVPRLDGVITDDYRIKMALPSIEFLLSHGSQIILISKVGRPKGFGDPEQTMLPVAKRLAKLLSLKLSIAPVRINGKPFTSSKKTADQSTDEYASNNGQLLFVPGDIREAYVQEQVRKATESVVLIENIRYYPEEEARAIPFSKMLASFGELYVFDAFAMAHRSEASVTGIPKYLSACAGLNVEKELTALNRILLRKAKPFVLIVGGAKISDKIGAIRNLGKHADHILIGGGLANLFFLAQGYEIGKSLCEKEKLLLARELIRNFKGKLLLPSDVVVAKRTAADSISDIRVTNPYSVKKSEAILDIGPKTILEFSNQVRVAKKMTWSGPLGYFEKKPFNQGTFSVAQIFASRSKGPAYGLVGGGDTGAAMNQAHVSGSIDFISTAGSAMLEYLAGKKLPGLLALE